MSKQNTLGERDFRSREKDEAREFLRLLTEVTASTAEMNNVFQRATRALHSSDGDVVFF